MIFSKLKLFSVVAFLIFVYFLCYNNESEQKSENSTKATPSKLLLTTKSFFTHNL